MRCDSRMCTCSSSVRLMKVGLSKEAQTRYVPHLHSTTSETSARVKTSSCLNTQFGDPKWYFLCAHRLRRLFVSEFTEPSLLCLAASVSVLLHAAAGAARAHSADLALQTVIKRTNSHEIFRISNSEQVILQEMGTCVAVLMRCAVLCRGYRHMQEKS